MAKAAAKTGIGPTTLIAIEQYFPKEQRILEDDLAYSILPFGLKAFVRMTKPYWFRSWMIRAMEKDAPGLYAGMMCRKKYIDEKLISSANKIDAVVNLGAGFDTRAFRISQLSNTPFWEIDQFENIQPKQKKIQKLFGTIPSHIKLISIDFDKEDLGSLLNQSGYSIGTKTFYIWEAVTQYLTENGIHSTFDFLSNAAQGSCLAFTYVRKDFIDGKVLYNWDKGYKQYVKSKIWLFGMEPGTWSDFLKNYGWKVIEDIGYEDLDERFVKPSGRVLASTPIERMVFAEKL